MLVHCNPITMLPMLPIKFERIETTNLVVSLYEDGAGLIESIFKTIRYLRGGQYGKIFDLQSAIIRSFNCLTATAVKL